MKNIMFLKLCLFVGVFLISACNLFSQHEQVKISSSSKQEVIKKTEKPEVIQGAEKQNIKPVNYINEDDIYQGREKEILNNLIVKEIPADFPKYEKGKGIRWYNQQMDNYYRTHPSIVTEMVRKKLGS